LIRAGFLDRLHPRGEAGRAALLGQTRSLPKKRAKGAQPELPLPVSGATHPVGWWESREARGPAVSALPPPVTDLERWESRVLGLNLHRHPLSAHREALAALGATPGRELRGMPHGAQARAAGVLESLQVPPTRSGALVHFLLTEDESGLLQSTVFERCYRRYGHVLYGRVEQVPRRGFSFVVDRIRDLGAALAELGAKAGTAALPGSATARRAG